MLLVTERLACNIALLYNNVANILTKSKHTVYKLYSNACNKLASIAYVSFTFSKEEASLKLPFLKVSLSNSTSNSRFSCFS